MVRRGVLLVAHGTPSCLADIPQFLALIRKGRPAAPGVVAQVVRRYEAIGGRSPLLDVTQEQARLLSERTGLPCEVAMRNWHPLLEESLRRVTEQGWGEAAVVVAAPHRTGVYEREVQMVSDRLREEGLHPPALRPVGPWGDEPALHQAWADAARAWLALDPREHRRFVLIPSAHSLPVRSIDARDPYPELVARTVDGVIARMGSDALPHILAFQSQGMSEGPWLGPSLPEAFDRAQRTGATGVLVLPVGFVTEHVETLHDLDMEARAVAEKMGLEFGRVPCLDAAPALLDVLATLVDRAWETREHTSEHGQERHSD